MTTVFISGSRKISRLNQDIKVRLNNILNQNFQIVLGDANGVDKAVQEYLRDHNYVNVTVFCSGNTCRNNLGNWNVSKVQVEAFLKGRDFYTIKDKAMANIADYGFVLWDGKSIGSYNNMLELIKRDKKTLIYFAPKKRFFVVSDLDDIREIQGKCDISLQNNIHKSINYPLFEMETIA